MDAKRPKLRSAYDADECRVMLKKMEEFEEKVLKKRGKSSLNNYTVINNITRKSFFIASGEHLTSDLFKDYFAGIGHAFALDYSTSYSIPLVLDLDCKACKNGNCGMKPTQILTMFVGEITELLCKLLGKKTLTFNLFKRCCNLHVYYDVSVSIILYCKIIDYLRTKLDSKWDEYHVDMVSQMAFPYSAKFDYECYNRIGSETNFLCSVHTLFLDLVLDANTSSGFGNEVFATFTCPSSLVSEWDSLNIQEQYILSSKDDEIKTFSQPQNIICKLKRMNYTVNSDYLILMNYFKTQAIPSVIVSDAKFEQQLMVLGQDVATKCIKVMELINKITFCDKMDKLDAFLSFLCGPNNQCSWFIPIFYSLVKYLGSVDLAKSFIKICTSYISDAKVLSLLTGILDKYRRIELDDVNFVEWLSYISYEIRKVGLNCLNDFDYFKNLIVGSKDDLTKTLVSYFHHTCCMVQTNDIYYIYSKTAGTYSMINEQALLTSNQNIVKYKTMIDAGKLLKELDPAMGEKGNKAMAKEVLEEAWTIYIMSLKNKLVDFNLYETLIATQYGIFDTVSGTYFANIPYIYFIKRKLFCTLPEDTSSMFSINTSLQSLYASDSFLLTFFLNHCNLLFYYYILIPGILASSLFTETTSKIISLYISNFILHDSQTTDDEFEQILSEISHYCTGTTNKIANVIEQVVQLKQSSNVSIIDVRGCLENSTIVDDVNDNVKYKLLAICFSLLSVKSEPIIFPIDFDQHEEFIKGSIPDAVALFENHPLLLLAKMFKFDSIKIKDFLNFASLSFKPKTSRKYFTLLLGPPRCGKSSILKWFEYPNELAVHSTDSVFKPGTSETGASPELIKITTSYAILCKEVTHIDASTLKVLTGADTINKRANYSNVFQKLSQFFFIIGAANSIPKITMADEAIRDRLIIFKLDVKFEQLTREVEYNILAGYCNNKLFIFTEPNVKNDARIFSNILYLQHLAINENFILSNQESRNEIINFIQCNNSLYRLLNKSNIVFNPTLEIGLDILMSILVQELDKNKLTQSPYDLERQLCSFFSSNYNTETKIFKGFGLIKEIKGKSSGFYNLKFNIKNLLIKGDATTTMFKLRKKLLTFGITLDEVDVLVQELKMIYSTNFTIINGSGAFTNLIINSNFN